VFIMEHEFDNTDIESTLSVELWHVPVKRICILLTIISDFFVRPALLILEQLLPVTRP
jgi:hypothetical protein